MSVRILCSCFLLYTWLSLSGGVRLYPCDAGYQDVVENTPLTFYCDQYPDTGSVSWMFRGSFTDIGFFVSTCTSTSCSASSASLFTVTFISGTNSSLTSPRTSRDLHVVDDIYQCEIQSCELHVIVPAVVSQPTTPVINRQDSGYTVSVSANITQVYSSRGLYSCIWQLGSSSQTTTPDLDPPASNTTDTAYRSGSCDVTMLLLENPGTYLCSVTVTPGNTQTSCDSITITRPSPPTVNCPSDFIAENTILTCKCNTDNIGQPGGRLRWYTGTGNVVSTLIISEDYDVTTLPLTWTVTRDDDRNDRKFRCINNWMVDINAQNDYTTLVAWGPDSVSIQGSKTFYTDMTGSLTMTLTCEASEFNPTSALTYSWDILCDDPQQSTCSFKPRPPSGSGDNGDVNREITCTVANVRNNNRAQQDTVTLNLKYPPRSPPQISGYVNNQILYKGDSLTLTCNVTGGDPQVKSVSLTCPGRHEQIPTNGHSSSLVISYLSASDHNLACVCRAEWEIESYYTLTDSRTLTVYSPVSSVQLKLNSQNRLLEVNESQSTDVVFECTADFARPLPNLMLSDDQGREVARLTGGSSDVTGQTVLTHTMRNVRCENSAIYTCAADNGVGEPVSSTATLRVLCEMRILSDSFDAQEDGIPILDASEQKRELHFQVLTTETPHIASFLYLGSDPTGDGYPPPVGLLSVTCEQTSVAYKSSCVLRVSNVTHDWAGYYNVTLATNTRAVSFTFRLQMQKTSDAGPTTGCRRQWFEGFGVGLGVGLAVLLLVICGQTVCLWRRQWRLPCIGTASHKEVNEPADNVESSLEMSPYLTSGATSDTGPYEELKQSDIGLRSVYSDIQPAPTHTAHISQEADGGYEIPVQRSAPAAQ